MNFNERKEIRTKHFNEYVKYYKLVNCIACNGSGNYDSNYNPDCSSCNGTGKERRRIKGLTNIKKLIGKNLQLKISDGLYMKIHVKRRNLILYSLIGENSSDNKQYRAKLRLDYDDWVVRPLLHSKEYPLREFDLIN